MERERLEIILRKVSLDMSFDDWLLHNYRMSSDQLKQSMLATGSPKDAELVYKWYMQRYVYERSAIADVKQIRFSL